MFFSQGSFIYTRFYGGAGRSYRGIGGDSLIKFFLLPKDSIKILFKSPFSFSLKNSLILIELLRLNLT